MGSAITPFSSIAAASAAQQVEFTESSLKVLDADLPFEIFEELLRSAGRVKRSMSWWIGDLLNFGSDFYADDRYAQAMNVTGLKYETLTNYAWVCRQVARSRRRDQVPFGVHSEVAKLPPREQDYWLREADKNEWTISTLRDALGRARDPDPLPDPTANGHGPLSPGAISSASGALVVTRRTLEKVAAGEDVARDVPRALRALEASGATLLAAAAVPTLRELVGRLLDESEPAEIVGTSLVLTATLDELRTLVGKEVPE